MKNASWQQRQAELKKAAIVEILHAVTSGESLASAAKRISKSYGGKRLPEGKRLHLSSYSLKRLWYLWKKNPSDSVFDLNYADGNIQSVIKPWVGHLLTDYAISHGLTIPLAYKQLKAADPDLPFSSRNMRRHLSGADQKRIGKAVALRKELNAIKSELETIKGGRE
ncbi:MAG: hypothetical protein K9M45_12855 [Kiritimatiellales bacterium]|nr:hypothetical protein [Kiritimatiellales bacterium]